MVHKYVSCADLGKAAGGDFNPTQAEDAPSEEKMGEEPHSVGMGIIQINDFGDGTLSLWVPDLTIIGQNGVAGRSIILHEDWDNYGQPKGDLGARVTCGTIAIVSSKQNGRCFLNAVKV